MKSYLLLTFMLLTLFSCNSSSRHETNEEIEIPSVEKIKSDLISRKVGDWTFEDLSEFENFIIKNYELTDDERSVFIYCETNLIGLHSSEKSLGKITVKYTLNEYNNWEFIKINGNVDLIENEKNEIENQYSENTKENNQNNNYDDKNSSEEKNNQENQNVASEKYTNCEWCSSSFKVSKKRTNTLLGEIEYWEGGADFCNDNDREEQNAKDPGGLKYLLNGATPNKYCSKKCACDAFNNR